MLRLKKIGVLVAGSGLMVAGLLGGCASSPTPGAGAQNTVPQQPPPAERPADAGETVGSPILPDAETPETPSTPAQPPAPRAATFPRDWIGRWAGAARLVSPDGREREFRMELIVRETEKPDRFGWTIVYADGNQTQQREYELVVIDALRGTYEIDERNSIRLPASLIDGALFGSFDVMSTRVITRDRLEDFGTPSERIVSEMLSFGLEADVTSGGAEGVPPVSGSRPRTLQRAILTRQDPEKDRGAGTTSGPADEIQR